MPLFKATLKWVKRVGAPTFFISTGSLFFVSCEWSDLLKSQRFAVSGQSSGKTFGVVAETNGASTSAGSEMMSPREKFAFHRWLVTEMQEQIFARPLRDRNSANGWANVLSQRGSIEGVYHGFVFSTDYAALEKGKPADVKALRFFGNEMALLDHPMLLENSPEVQEAAAKYVKNSMAEHSSLFTLKRELGERILKESLIRKNDLEKLAAWYASIVSRWAKMDVPFGLPQRNDRDEVFHFEWAKKNTFGMLQWELLNREHRIFNQLGGVTVVSPAGK